MTFPPRSTALRLAVALLASALAGCSSMDRVMSGDRIDYKSQGAAREKGLDVPPDLSQLSRDSRYQPVTGTSVSAAQYQAGTAQAAPAATGPAVAPAAVGDVKLVRQGDQRWLTAALPPEQVWPLLESFWKENGFVLTVTQPEAGLMETDWAENRAKIPQDIIRNTLGRVLDSLYSTGERDKFRTRIERTGTGSEIFLTHRGMQEVYSGANKETTVWQPRPADPQLEAAMLQRMMVKLGAREDQARAAAGTATATATGTATAPAATARARVVEGQPGATLQVDDGFDRAWRRVGLALDRSGFTVEDRDRAQGLYFVRYVDPAQAGREEPGFFRRLFSFGRRNDAGGPARYRVQVKGDGDRSTVSVLNAQGQPEGGDAGKRIVSLLLEDLR